MTKPPFHHEAHQHLSKADKTMASLIKKVGHCSLRPQKARTLFESLVIAVANQQLSGKAAATILGRFKALFPGKRFPEPADVLQIDPLLIRGAGMSNAKVAAIRDIAAKSIDGTVPAPRAIARLADVEIIERLTSIRGVGLWTVEMLLIFKLGRPDVLPATDLGVRKGFAQTFGHVELPPPKELLAYGERWRPFRSVAAWYLWRSLDLENGGQM
jgi:DNA-3-methyladenine glycosylase II